MKRTWTPEQRQTCAVAGLAMPNGDYPILDREDLQIAIDNHEHAKDVESARTHITSRAKALGATDLLPSHWADSTKPADKLARAARSPIEASANTLRARLSKAATPSERAEIQREATALAGALGAQEAFRRSQRTPISCLKIGA